MVRTLTPDESILAMDVGEARIGLARAGAFAKLPEPLPALKVDSDTIQKLQAVISKENIGLIVVGVPRNLNGEETSQSQKIREFAKELTVLNKEVVFVDESLSSKRADTYLADNKKSSADQDSIAACFILEEYFNTIGNVA